MKGFITIFFITAGLTVFGQDIDTVELKRHLIGEWELIYSLDIDTNDVVKDTITTELTRTTIGLKIDENSVDEFWDFWDYPDDSTIYMGIGKWEIRNYKAEKEIWVDFDCESMFLCGFYQFISLKNNILILKSCSKYNYEGCEIIYLKRKDATNSTYKR